MVAIRKGDLVKVTAGKERGKEGKVLRVVPETGRVFIEKLNIIKKHTRPSQNNPKGGIVEKEGPVHRSNLMLICPNCGKPTRVGTRVLPDGNKMRQCVKCKEVLDKS
jgi:large subunit ribosomal protein L24